ncbi:Metallo-hydrolase/oxidoreductase [Xylariaceae sp. FL0594]|nr:Metallo-hydrolase/oxidoreductase [Xylariaceae sp. FL0594]
MRPTRHLHIDPSQRRPLLRDQKSASDAPSSLHVTRTHIHPSHPDYGPGLSSERAEDASVSFIGTATAVIEWQGLRILTDPNFLHEGDHVHLGPGVTAQRVTNPAVDIDDLPGVDLVLLSHYHEDHFDRLVEGRLNRDFDIVTTPHARACLTNEKRYVGKDDAGPFRAVHDVDHFESIVLHVDGVANQRKADGKKSPIIKITGMPGKHVPPGPLAVANDLLGAVPPTNGWLLEMGWAFDDESQTKEVSLERHLLETGYRIYISGDTLLVDELKEIPRYIREQQLAHEQRAGETNRIDLMIVHLGGTTIPGPKMPLLMVTMDAKQGVELMKLMNPDLTIPIHFDDYDVFLSPLKDFKTEVENMGADWKNRVVYLDRGEQFRFKVRGPQGADVVKAV